MSSTLNLDKLCSDENLVSFTAMGNISAWHELSNRYYLHSQTLAKWALGVYTSSVYEYDDFFQMAFTTLEECLSKYVNFSFSFYAFWKKTVLIKFQHFVYTESSKFERNPAIVCLDADLSEDSRYRNEDVIGLSDSKITDNIDAKDLLKTMKADLVNMDQEEKKLLKLLMLGYERDEICEELKITPSKFYRIWNKVRSILKTI